MRQKPFKTSYLLKKHELLPCFMHLGSAFRGAVLWYKGWCPLSWGHPRCGAQSDCIELGPALYIFNSFPNLFLYVWKVLEKRFTSGYMPGIAVHTGSQGGTESRGGLWLLSLACKILKVPGWWLLKMGCWVTWIFPGRALLTVIRYGILQLHLYIFLDMHITHYEKVYWHNWKHENLKIRQKLTMSTLMK